MRKHILIKAFCLSLTLVFVGLLLWINLAITQLGNAGVGGICKDCHSGPKAKELGLTDINATTESLQFKHSVVEEERCDICHIIKGFKTGRTWELFSSDEQKEQIFFLKDLSWDRKYKVGLRIRDNAGKESLANPIHFTPSQVSTFLDNDQMAPLIKNVEIEEIRQKIFLEAVIKWETDEPSNSIIEYGLTPQYGETVLIEKVFTKRHKIVMAGLKVGKQYHYRVSSRDIFGNISVSNDFVLDTAEQIGRGEASKAIDRTQIAVKEIGIFRLKESKDIYIRVIAEKPVKIYLTINEPAEIDEHGFGLVPARFSRIDACLKCHAQGASHPVGIRSKGLKTKIPVALPTIEGGVITCITCHYPHGGNKRYFARLDFQRDMCVSCHIGEPFI